MIDFFKNLAALKHKKERMIIGLMSGTSLDGLDIALCKFSGSGFQSQAEVICFETILYPDELKRTLKKICFRENISLSALTKMNKYFGNFCAEAVISFLGRNRLDSASIDLIASHGQTVFHAPASATESGGHATFQIGDGDHIAVKTGIVTISDFRQKHIASGGEGAPLAPYGDLLLFGDANSDVLLINIGGIANFTFISSAGIIECGDCGPGNTLLNYWSEKKFMRSFDNEGKIAATGIVVNDLLRELLEESMRYATGKSTGPEIFSADFLELCLSRCSSKNIKDEDVMATLTKFTAEKIFISLRDLNLNNGTKIYVSGGGAKNLTLVEYLHAAFPASEFLSTETKGINPDAKEAVLFALLANECTAGDPGIFNDISPALPAIRMGKISLPA